ncbi:hypothetical protein PF003_g12839 [Phytophthora fragariae]|nr:hypothetical protein PF003_g12839 [Phytophthora fragariae]
MPPLFGAKVHRCRMCSGLLMALRTQCVAHRRDVGQRRTCSDRYTLVIRECIV